MKLTWVLLLSLFLLSLNSNAKGRTNRDQNNSRSPASDSSNPYASNNSNSFLYSNRAPEVQKCVSLGLADVNSCQAAYEGRASVPGFNVPHPGTGDKILPDQNSEVRPVASPKDRSEFVAACVMNTDKSPDECGQEWDQHYSTKPNDSPLEAGSAIECTDPTTTRDETTNACRAKTPEELAADQDRNEPNPAAEKPEEKVDMCPTAHAAVTGPNGACNTESQSWMTSINNVTKQLGPTLNQINPSTCGGIAAASSGAEGAIAAFEVMCNNATKQCLEACAGTDPQSVQYAKECKAKGTKAAEAQQRVTSAMLTLQGSVASCQNAFGDLNAQAQAHCAANPAACQFNVANNLPPGVPQGDQAGLPGAPLDHTGASGGNSVGGSGGYALDDLGDDELALGEIKPGKPGEDVGGNKGGGGVSGGGGSGAGGPAGSGGGKGDKGGLFGTGILSGFFGSGGGSGGSGGAWKSWFGGNKGGYDNNQQAAKPKGPDLRQFLPGGMHDPSKNRGIAGQFIGKDGMTGPHSDIWKNINNRYQYKRASLLP